MIIKEYVADIKRTFSSHVYTSSTKLGMTLLGVLLCHIMSHTYLQGRLITVNFAENGGNWAESFINVFGSRLLVSLLM